MAVWHESTTGSLYSVLLCSAATVCNGAMSCFTGRLMSEKLNVLQFTFYTAPVSCIALLPFYLFVEVRLNFLTCSLMHLVTPLYLSLSLLLQHREFMAYMKLNAVPAIAVILVTSAVALVYNILHSSLIHNTSAVTVTVLGEFKICGILLLSAWLLGKHVWTQLCRALVSTC